MKALLQFAAIMVIVTLTTGCKSVANYPIDEPSAANVEDRLVGKWKCLEDTGNFNYYEVEKSVAAHPYEYHVKFWNKKGWKPPGYEANVYFSRVENSLFLNVPYLENDLINRKHFLNNAYFFLKVLEVDAACTKMTTATVLDTTLRRHNSSTEVKALITANLNNPKFYYDTVHFYKVE